MTVPTDPRKAFTLMEIMVVVCIISVLIALLLPAVQSSREVARRIQCTNNLYQLGVALENYASSHRVYPPGVVDFKGPIDANPVGYHFGWAVQLLPFMEQKNIYHNINFTLGVYADGNTTATEMRINTLLCPSSAISSGTNYAGCHNDVEKPIDVDDNGVFFLNSRIARRDLVDGPASTILIGETRYSMTFGTWAMGTTATLRNAGWGVNDDHAPDVALRKSLVPGGATRADRFDPVVLQSMIEKGELATDLVGGFASEHSSGANFLFADGSVHFLKSRVDRSVLRALAHRFDGEVIDGEAY